MTGTGACILDSDPVPEVCPESESGSGCGGAGQA